MCAVAIVGLAAHEGHEVATGRTFTVGKKGDVNIREDVKIGTEYTLKKGKYLFEHRVEGDQHVIVLTGIVKAGMPVPVYAIPTRTLASRTASKQSVFVAKELVDHSLQIAVVHISGEALEHLPAGLDVRTAEGD
jgi:hypothetical protein